jgi:hypothetical protein
VSSPKRPGCALGNIHTPGHTPGSGCWRQAGRDESQARASRHRDEPRAARADLALCSRRRHRRRSPECGNGREFRDPERKPALMSTGSFDQEKTRREGSGPPGILKLLTSPRLVAFGFCAVKASNRLAFRALCLAGGGTNQNCGLPGVITPEIRHVATAFSWANSSWHLRSQRGRALRGGKGIRAYGSSSSHHVRP